MKKYFLVSLLFLINNAFAYVATRTEYNQKLAWDSRSSALDIYIDPTPMGGNTSSLTENSVKEIITSVMESWQPYSPYQLDYSFTYSLPPLATSRSIRFTEDSSYFGSGVLAVTSVSHSASTGKIYSADILINGSMTNPNIFTADKNVSGGYYAYLGDVLTHEMGHFLGLGHSEVFGASMIFSVFKGQHIPHTDDISGLNSLYSHINNGGSITGTIITGSSIPVFGAQVQAISYKTGKAVAGVFSESDGSFSIDELPIDDSYLIYVLPARSVDNLPIFYQSIETRYCSSKSFVPSFFTKCGGASKGKPQVIAVSNKEEVSVGSITIRCDEGMDPLYLRGKAKQEKVTIQEMTSYNKSKGMGATYVGYFSKAEVSSGLTGGGDKLEVDLSGYTVDQVSTYYLNIKLISKEIGSAIGLYANLYDSDGTLIQTADIGYGSFGQRETDLEFNVDLSTDPSKNIFTLHVFPRSLTSTELNEIFANYTEMTNSNSTYLILTSLKAYENGKYITYGLKDSSPYEDNYYCTEGEATTTARPNAITSTLAADPGSNSDLQSANAMSCGTIDIDSDGGPGGGMMSFTLGAMLIFLIGYANRKSNDFLSK